MVEDALSRGRVADSLHRGAEGRMSPSVLREGGSPQVSLGSMAVFSVSGQVICI